MKQLIIIAAVLCSCNKVKDYKCEVFTSTDDVEYTLAGDTYFTGTKEEMKAYEEDNTFSYTLGGETNYILTDCKK